MVALTANTDRLARAMAESESRRPAALCGELLIQPLDHRNNPPSPRGTPFVHSSSSMRPADLTDLPPDVLPFIFRHLDPGHRLALRAVCRRWADWVDGPLLGCRGAVQLNLVMDAGQLQRARSGRRYAEGVRAAGRSLAQAGRIVADERYAEAAGETPDVGGSTAINSESAVDASGAALLPVLFPEARAVRLWVGCRPPAVLAGPYGGGAAAAIVDAIGNGGGGRAGVIANLLDAASVAVEAASEGIAVSAAVLQAAVVEAGRAALAALKRTMLLSCRCIVLPRMRPDRVPEPRLNVRWYAHGAARGGQGVGGGGGNTPLLRRYAPDEPDPALPPLPACLPLLGGSQRLTRLSLVTALDVTDEDLRLLAATFPGLRSLALHAHQGVRVDPGCVPLTSLAPLFVAEDTQQTLPPPPPRPARQGGKRDEPLVGNGNRACVPGPAPSTASGQGSRTGTPGADAVKPSTVPAPALPPPSPPLPSPLQLRSLVLSGVRCEWPPGEGLARLAGLRSLVLHRVVARMQGLLHDIRALTQLTRLELRRVDYHHALTCQERRLDELQLLRAKAASQALRQESRQRRRQAAAAALEAAEGLLQQESVSEEDAEREAAEAEAEEAAEAEAWFEARTPLLRLPSVHFQEWWHVRPDWPATMAAIGLAVAPLTRLRVLVCDVEPPEVAQESGRSPWPGLLSALPRLPALERLSLPALALASPAQARSLAAALPHLRRLELRCLPPPACALPPAERPGWPSAVRCCSGSAESAARELERLQRGYERWLLKTTGAAQNVPSGAEAEAAVGDSNGNDNDSEGGSISGFLGGVDACNTCGSGCGCGSGGGSGCLACFTSLRGLTLHAASVAQLADHTVPLPWGLRELRAPMRALTPSDVLLLHHALLPALAAPSPRPVLALRPGRCAAPEAGPGLTCLMLRATLGASLHELDLRELTHPAGTSPEEVLEGLRHVARGLPRLRRLGCCLTLGPTGLLQPAGAAAAATRPGTGDAVAAAGGPHAYGGRQAPRDSQRGRGRRSPLPREFSQGTDLAVAGPVLESFGAMRRLEALRVKVFERRPQPASANLVNAYKVRRVPLGLLRTLPRPVRVVDCSPLDAWCSSGPADGPTDPRVALSRARAALAAAGCRCTLAAEAEEWAADAMGLEPEGEAAWRSEDLEPN